MSARGWLYRIGRLMGDVTAVKKRKVARRVGRRAAGKATGGLFRRIFG